MKVSGNIDYKTKRCPGTGMQLTSKWSTDNVLNTSLDLQVNHTSHILVQVHKDFLHTSILPLDVGYSIFLCAFLLRTS